MASAGQTLATYTSLRLLCPESFEAFSFSHQDPPQKVLFRAEASAMELTFIITCCLQDMFKVAAWEGSSTIPQGLKVPAWSTDLSLDFMNRNGIGTTVLSLSAPATAFVRDRAESARLCREVNEYAASVRDQQPLRFGFFATLPALDDVSSCLDEIAFAFDVLRADGVTLMTSYGKAYLGHADFRPIWKDLNQRGAVVFIHPSMNMSAGTLENPYVPQPLIDFPHETTRTAVHLIVSNTVRDHPNCKMILSHGGGTLPYVATRVAHLTADGKFGDKTAEQFVEEARSFYYDLALTAYNYPLDLILNFAQPGHILYGSDFPFAREMTSKPQLAFLDQCAMDEKVDFSIRRGAALELFPRLRTS